MQEIRYYQLKSDIHRGSGQRPMCRTTLASSATDQTTAFALSCSSDLNPFEPVKVQEWHKLCHFVSGTFMLFDNNALV